VTIITSYHAHLYFDESSIHIAKEVAAEAQKKFGVFVGHFHERKVGPHPRWSVQMGLAPQQFAEVIPWLMIHRRGLTVFTHPETGDDIKDHTDHAIWMGELLPLNLEIFKPR
jgi:aromatic ring-cleaving dioxygenase